MYKRQVVGLVPEIIDKVSALFKKDTKEKKEEADQIKLDDPQV